MAGANYKDPAGTPKRPKEDRCKEMETVPVHIHLHCDGKERGEDPCININVNVSQCNQYPEFTTCFGDTVYYMNGTGTHEDPGPTTPGDPPPQ